MKFTNLQLIFGLIISIVFVTMILLLMFFEVPDANKSAVNILIGAIGGSFTTVIAYYFGSSKSSQNKDEIIHNLKKDKNG